MHCGSSLQPFDHACRLKQGDVLSRAHPFPTFVWQVSPLDWRDRHVAHFEDEWRKRGIGKLVVVVNGELAERFVAGDKLPMICVSSDHDWAHLHVRDDEPIEPELVMIVPHLFSRTATTESTSPSSAHTIARA